MKHPLLSICISTYNREGPLRYLLKNITTQRGFSLDEVEICIVNDPSNDETESMVHGFKERYPNIHFHRNSKRAGMIPSILQVAQMGKGEYIWLFSDDDVLHPEALEVVLGIIRTEHPGLILNKFLGFQGETPPLEQSHVSDGSIVKLRGMNELFQYFRKIPYSIDGYMMHCSLFCFRREIFLKNLETLLGERGEAYMDTLKKDYFGHVRIVYIPYGNERTIVILEKDLVLLRGGNISWTFVFKVCTDYRDLVNDLREQYTIPLKTYMKMKVLYYYSVFTYFVIVHLPRYIPRNIYNFCIEMGKKFVRIIKIG